MSVKFNVTGGERKALVKAISEFLVLEAVYKGAPTFAYEIGGCTVDRYGTLTFSESVTDAAAALLITALKERGYEGETDEVPESGEDAVSDCTAAVAKAHDSEVLPPVESDQPSDNGDQAKLSIALPRAEYSDEVIDRLKKIISSKETLLKKALGADSLPVELDEEKLNFPWFTLTGPVGTVPRMSDEADAYTRFVTALCKMAKEQKRITASEREVENERFTMRLFLVRLGFVGEKFKAARKILLRNLSGNTAWRDGQRPQRAAETVGVENTGGISASDTPEELAEALADAQLIREVNASFESDKRR